MSAATGLGPIELLLLESFDTVGAVADSGYVKNMRVLDVLEYEYGIAPAIGYRMICELARADRQHLCLVDFHGNHGSQDFGPASPKYTEGRLTPLGSAALGSERGNGVRLPIGLVNGNTFLDGRRPPLDPTRTAVALRAAASQVSDDDLAAIVGPPQFPTACRVDGEFERLAAGEQVELTLRPRLTDLGAIQFGDGRELRIDAIPPTTGASEIAETILNAGLPGVRDINDMSADDVSDLRVWIDSDASVGEVTSQLEAMWPIRTTITAAFGAPIATILREFVHPLSPAELEQALTAITAR